MIHPDQSPLLAVELPVKLTNGNDGRGSKWFQTAKDRKRLETLLRALGHVYSPLPFPVQLRVTRLLGKRERFWDASSCGRGNFKELEDAAVACGWFHDDCYEWIRGVYFEQRKEPRDKPAVLVEIFKLTTPTT